MLRLLRYGTHLSGAKACCRRHAFSSLRAGIGSPGSVADVSSPATGVHRYRHRRSDLEQGESRFLRQSNLPPDLTKHRWLTCSPQLRPWSTSSRPSHLRWAIEDDASQPWPLVSSLPVSSSSEHSASSTPHCSHGQPSGRTTEPGTSSSRWYFRSSDCGGYGAPAPVGKRNVGPLGSTSWIAEDTTDWVSTLMTPYGLGWRVSAVLQP